MRHTVLSMLVGGLLFVGAVGAIGFGLSHEAFAYVAAASSSAMYVVPLRDTVSTLSLLMQFY